MNKILNIKIDNVSFGDAMAKIAAYLLVEDFHQICTINPEFLVSAQQDETFKEILNKSDLNVPDGFGLQCAAWFLGQKIGERITGVDLTWEICKLAAEKGYSVYLLGAAEGVAEIAAHRLRILNPGLKIAGIRSPIAEVDGTVESNIIDDINKSEADILLVAFGAPKQEKFLNRYRDQLKVKLAMGNGGTLDYIAENVPYAPLWMRKAGLEWFYRLFTQPKRWKRICNAVCVFPWLVLKSKFRKG
jgi:N-acetylglucosaminyldiphosphoundecaprenol N-acetyl-beta-D-mannosaminyltransferase